MGDTPPTLPQGRAIDLSYMLYLLAWLAFVLLTYIFAWWDTSYYYKHWDVKIPQLWDSLFEH